MQMFGGSIPSMIVGFISQLFMSSSNIGKYDFRLDKDQGHQQSFVTPNLNAPFYVDDGTF